MKKPKDAGYIPATKTAQYSSMKCEGGKSPRTSSDSFNPTKGVGDKAGTNHGYKSAEKGAGQ